MEITVKVVSILPPLKITSQRSGNIYIKNTFIGETNGQYPKKIAFTVMGEEKFKQMNIIVGGVYNVSFDIESKEWKGKWFTEVSAWKALSSNQPQQPVQQMTQPQPAPQYQQQQASAQQNANNDDLPF